MLLATLKEPPPLGSPREALLVLLWLQREQMEHAQTYALIQTLVDKDKAKDAFDHYKKVRFPWVESSNEKERLNHIKKLMEEVKKGPLQITPMTSPRMQSRMKTKIAQRSEDETKKTQKNIYSKIGQAIPR